MQRLHDENQRPKKLVVGLKLEKEILRARHVELVESSSQYSQQRTTDSCRHNRWNPLPHRVSDRIIPVTGKTKLMDAV